MPIEMLKLHWKASKWFLLPMIAAAFALPFLNWTGGPLTNLMVGDSGYDLLFLSDALAVFYPYLAALAGSVLALTAWNWDHQKGHVYPLSLPISRMRYSVLKFGSGAVLLMVPTAVLLVTGLGASMAMDVPYGLEAYPVELSTRFFIAGMTAYAGLFALASGTIRTTVILIAAVVSFFVAGDAVQMSLATLIPSFEGWSVTTEALNLLESEYSPFRVFAGNWMLIDV